MTTVLIAGVAWLLQATLPVPTDIADGSQASPARASALSLLDEYERTGRVHEVAFANVGTFTSGLDAAAEPWIALLPLEIVYGHRDRISPDDLKLVEWSCGFLRRGQATEFERVWMLGSFGLIEHLGPQFNGAPHPDVMRHLDRARRRFPGDARLRLAELLTRPEVWALSNRPGAPPSLLVRDMSLRGWRQGGNNPAQIEVTLGDLGTLALDPDVGPEVRTHIGILRFHRNELASSLLMLTGAAEAASDPLVRNLSWLFAGLTPDAEDRRSEATTACQHAVDAMPPGGHLSDRTRGSSISVRSAVDVSVKVRDLPVRGLTGADFEILDNGVRQPVRDVSLGPMPIALSPGAGARGRDLLIPRRRACPRVYFSPCRRH